MNSKKYLFFILVLVCFCVFGLIFFMKPNGKYLSHALCVSDIDSEYDLIQYKHDREGLLWQEQELLPHLRRGYYRYRYNMKPGESFSKRKSFLQQRSFDLTKLLEEAAQTQLRLSCFLMDFSNKHPNSRVYIPAIKGMKTIQDLLQTRWDGDASMITDYARATISFPSLKMMYQSLEDLKKTGIIILQIKDNFLVPCLGGYRDVTIVFRDFVNGHLGEIQFNIHSIMEFKNGLGTDLFHVIRTIQAIPLLENRPLSQEEEICLNWLFEKERNGYEEALKKAL